MVLRQVLDFVSRCTIHTRGTNSGSEVAAHLRVSIGELWMCSSWGQPRLLKLHYFSLQSDSCHAVSETILLYSKIPSQEVFMKRFLDTWLTTFKARFRNENCTARMMEASSSTATLRTITCSDSSQYPPPPTRQQPRATTDNRPNQAQPEVATATFPPPVPSLQSILVPDILQAQTAHVSTIVRLFLLEWTQESANPHPLLVEVIRRTRLPATHTVPQELLRQA
jgi:hypothetical protein